MKFLLLALAVLAGFQAVLFLAGAMTVRLSREKEAAWPFGKKLAEKRRVVIAWAVCRTALVLPYRIRETYIVALHFIFYSMRAKLAIAFRILNNCTQAAVLLATYFLALPVALILKQRGRYQRLGFNPSVRNMF